MPADQAVARLQAQLPRRPDSETGQPPPPRAPAYGVDIELEHDTFREARLSCRPDPPPGRSPVLAWRRENGRSKIFALAVSFAFMTVGTVVIFAFRELPLFEWVRLKYWPVWLAITVAALLMSRPWRNEYISAGADWVSFGATFPARWRKGPGIKVYELTKVRTSVAVGRRYLDITDSDNVTIERPLADFERDVGVWALVYNGILHSVANGADIRLGDAKALFIREDSPAILLNQHHRGIRLLPDTPSESEPSSEPDRPTVHLPTHGAGQANDELVRKSGALCGSPFQHGGSVWLQRQDGSTVQVIWPSGFHARFDPVELLDSDGKVLAREGDRVVLTGTVRAERDGMSVAHAIPGLDAAFVAHAVDPV